MRRIFLIFVIVILILIAFSPLSVKASNGEKVKVIIQFERPSYAEYIKSHKNLPMSTFTKETYINNVEKEHENILSTLLNRGIYIKKRWDYFLSYNGVSAEVDKDQIETLKKIPGIKNVFITKTFKPLLDLSVPLIRASEVWKMNDEDGLPVTGKGMKIGIIDTGIDYNHPDLGGPGFPNDKVVGGYDFADDDDDPMDNTPSTWLYHGHGTHVAGITAANGKIKGVAPDALLYAYKVVTDAGGGISDSDVLAAVEQALKDGCTSVNLSLGSPGGNSEGTSYLDAINNAVDLGLIVVAAAGNEGVRCKETRWPISSPSSAKKAISVAASDDFGRSLNIVSPDGYEDVFIPYRQFADAPEFEEGKGYEVIDCGFGRYPKDFEGKDVKGKVVLIERGPLYPEKSLYFGEKVEPAVNMGAVGAIIYNCTPGPTKGYAYGEYISEEKKVPAVFIMQKDGILLKSLIKNGLKVKFSKRKLRENSVIADFSSQGPTPDSVFKPEVSAPGVDIYSTYPDGKYEFMGGTSMATPHVAGSVVLLKQLHPDWTPEDIKTALMNNAFILENPSNKLPFSWTDQGAGRIDVYAAATTPLLIRPFDIFLKAEKTLLSTKNDVTIFEVKNVSDKDTTFSVSSKLLSMVKGISFSYMDEEKTFTVKAGKTIGVPFMYNIEDNLPDNYYEGVVYFKTEDRTLHVPIIIQKGLPKPPKKVLELLSVTPEKISPNGDGVDETMVFHFKLNFGELVIEEDMRYRTRYNGVEIDVLDENGNFIKQIWGEPLMAGEYKAVWNGKDMNGKYFLENGKYKYKIYAFTVDTSDPGYLKIKQEGIETGYFTVEGVAFPVAKITGRDSVPNNTEFSVDITAKVEAAIKKVVAELDFNPEYLEVVEVTAGDFFKQGDMEVTVTPEIDKENGKLKVTVERDAEKGVSGGGVVFRVKFKALESGAVRISITDFTAYTDKNELLTNFLLSEKLIKITLLMGDIDEDGKVDSSDLIIFAQAFGSQEGDPNWDEKCDLNGDGKVDTEDLLLLAQNFGNVAP